MLCERLERLACDFPLKDNYFAWQAFGRRYPRRARPRCRPICSASNYEAIRRAPTASRSVQRAITELLSAKRRRRASTAIVLLDAQDWMSDAELNALWTEITRTARPGARVIFRTAAEPTLLPGRVADGIARPLDVRGRAEPRARPQDRSAIYGGFHLYMLKPP